ncbi:dethiobiotin synthase [Allorhizobium sp. NPDC080224]|uniref:dethiobiotin synthase n=1 Tax=Allorhizobium sp. NPDC080224 TaxID=3390547 RepID=UPI003D06728F
MTRCFIVTGTDTGIGKTVFSSALVGVLNGYYWKPIQSGLDQETDSEVVRRLSGLANDRILPEAWRLRTPASPHLSAAIDRVAIVPAQLRLPDIDQPLVIEGAGGLLVPLTRKITYIEVFSQWAQPVILCARTELGTINHTLMSIETLRRRAIPIAGVAFIGDERADTQEIIGEMTAVPILGRLPILGELTQESLRNAFEAHFDLSFLEEWAVA